MQRRHHGKANRRIAIVMAVLAAGLLVPNPAAAVEIGLHEAADGETDAFLTIPNRPLMTADFDGTDNYDTLTQSGTEVADEAVKLDLQASSMTHSSFDADAVDVSVGNDLTFPEVASGVGKVAAAEDSNLAIGTDGFVYAWGDNSASQLGDGSTTMRTSPVRVLRGEQTSSPTYLQNIVFVSMSSNHALAIDSAGDVWAWGDNSDGKLGVGSTLASSTPKHVLKGSQSSATSYLTNIVFVAAGRENSYAVDNTGALYAWGNDAWGGLGRGAPAGDALTPVRVLAGEQGGTNLANVAGVATSPTSGGYTAAWTTDGFAFEWGTINGRAVNSPEYVYNGLQTSASGRLQNVESVSAGERHFVAKLTTGAVYSWGPNNSVGEFGSGVTGGTANANIPILGAMQATGTTSNIGAPRERHGAVSDGTSVYTIGGVQSSSSQNTLYRTNMQTGAVTELATLPQTRYMGAAVYAGASIYYIGGVAGSACCATNTNSIVKYNVGGNSWSTIAATLTWATTEVSAVWDGGTNVYVFQSSGCIGKVWKLDTATDALTTMLDVNAGGLSCANAGVIFAHGAFWSGSVAYLMPAYWAGDTKAILKYSPASNSIQKISAAMLGVGCDYSIRQLTWGFDGVAAYAYADCDGDGTYHIHRFSPADERLEVLSEISVAVGARNYAGTAYVSSVNRVAFTGGGSGFDTLQWYQPGRRGPTIRDNPAFFERPDGTRHMIVGMEKASYRAGPWASYQLLNGAWVLNNAVGVGLPSDAVEAAPEVFTLSGNTYMLIGSKTTCCSGYRWVEATTAWVRDTTIENGPSSSLQAYFGSGNTFARPTVFAVGGATYLVVGEYNGGHYGFVWTGSNWALNAQILSGLAGAAKYAAPEAFNYGGQTYLVEIKSPDPGDVEVTQASAYRWTGSTWTPDATRAPANIASYSYPNMEVYEVQGQVHAFFGHGGSSPQTPRGYTLGASGWLQGKSFPVSVVAGAQGSGSFANAVYAAALGDGGIAVDNTGAVYAWGQGTSGELGNGASSNQASPVRVLKGAQSGATYLSGGLVAAGGSAHTLVATDEQKLYAFGAQTNGALGNLASSGSQTSPVKVEGGAQGTLQLGVEVAGDPSEVTSGSYTSDVISGLYEVTATSDSRSTIGSITTTLEMRSGWTSVPDAFTWTAWGQGIPEPRKYYQYRYVFAKAFGDATSSVTVDDVVLDYTAYAASGTAVVKWTVPNGLQATTLTLAVSEDVPAGSSLSYQVSTDAGGSTYAAITPGTAYAVSPASTTVRIRATLASSWATPAVEDLSLSWGSVGEGTFSGATERSAGPTAEVNVASVTPTTNLASSALVVPVSDAVQSVVSVNKPLRENLAGEWRFDEAGATASNAVGSNHGSVNGGVTQGVAGQAGSAYSFDGVNDYISIPDLDAYSVTTTGDLTVELWFKRGDMDQGVLIAKGGSPWEWVIALTPSNTVRLQLWDAAGSNPIIEVATTTAVTDTATWHQFIAVVDSTSGSTGTAKLYLDGVLSAAQVYGGGNSATNTVAGVFIGKRGDGLGEGFFKGLIDQPRIYNRVMHAAEVAAVYANPSPASTATVPLAAETSLAALGFDEYFFDAAAMFVYVGVWSQNGQTMMRTINSALGVTFDITTPTLLTTGDYYEVSGTARNSDGLPVEDVQVEVTFLQGGVVKHGPVKKFIVQGNIDVAVSTNPLIPGDYDVEISFRDSTDIEFIETRQLTVSSGRLSVGAGAYSDARVHFTFFEADTGFGLDANFLKVFVNDQAPPTNLDRVSGTTFPTATGLNVKYRVEDYWGDKIYPVGAPQYASFDVTAKEMFVDVALGLANFKIKNTNSSVVHFHIEKGATELSEYILPQEIVDFHLLPGTYQVTLDYYHAATGEYLETVTDEVAIASDIFYWIRGHDLADIVIEINNVGATLEQQLVNVNVNVNNINSNIGTQVNSIQTSIQNLESTITNQINSVLTDIQNTNTVIESQVNFISTQIENFESNITLQLNTFQSSVNNQFTNIVTQVNAIQSMIVNTETNITTQLNAIEVQITNLDTSIGEQFNDVTVLIENHDSDIKSQLNTIHTAIINSNASIVDQVNIIRAVVQNTESNITTQYNALHNQVQVFESNVTNLFTLTRTDIEYHSSVIINHLDGVNATIVGEVVARLVGLELNVTARLLNRTGQLQNALDAVMLALGNTNLTGIEDVLDITDAILGAFNSPHTIYVPQFNYTGLANDTLPPHSALDAYPSLEDSRDVVLRWLAKDNVLVKGVTIWIRKDNSTPWIVLGEFAASGGTKLVTGLGAGQTYEFRSQAEDAAGNVEPLPTDERQPNYASIEVGSGTGIEFEPPEGGVTGVLTPAPAAMLVGLVALALAGLIRRRQ